MGPVQDTADFFSMGMNENMSNGKQTNKQNKQTGLLLNQIAVKY